MASNALSDVNISGREKERGRGKGGDKVVTEKNVPSNSILCESDFLIWESYNYRRFEAITTTIPALLYTPQMHRDACLALQW